MKNTLPNIAHGELCIFTEQKKDNIVQHSKIKSLSELPKLLEQLHQQQSAIVLAGGVFDILHPGHVMFLKEAQSRGDILLLLLESDESVKKYKGENRPIFSQQQRAEVLAALEYVDFIVMLEGILEDEDYYRLTSSIKPAIIAATTGDSAAAKKRAQADQTNASYIELVDRIGNHSSTDIIEKLNL